jgi:hypothetical protein
MTRLASHLDAIEAWVTSLQSGGKPLVVECRRQLDLVDAEEIARVSFRSPAAFLVLPRFRLASRADGGKDCEIWVVLALASRARPGASADADVIDRVITAAVALEGTTFAASLCSGVNDIECRPVLSTAIETKGLAVAALSFRQTLYRVVEPPRETLGLAGATGAGAPRPGCVPQPFQRADGDPTPDEQAIIDSWGSEQ